MQTQAEDKEVVVEGQDAAKACKGMVIVRKRGGGAMWG